MAGSVIVSGMVLSSMPVGDYDKRIVLLTKERGKIVAFARGARRPKSSLVASTDPFCFGRFEAYEGRNSYTVVKAEIDYYFRELTEDIDSLYYGYYFLELSEYFSAENIEAAQQLNLLFVTIKALLAAKLSRALIRIIFELKLLVLNGTYPDLYNCKYCKRQNDLYWYEPSQYAIVCDRCDHSRNAIHLDPAAVYALQYIMGISIAKLYSFTVTDVILNQMQNVVSRILKANTDRKFKTEAFLEET